MIMASNQIDLFSQVLARQFDELFYLVCLGSLIVIGLIFVAFALICWVGVCEIKDRIKGWLYDRKHPLAPNRATSPLGLGKTNV